MFIQASGEQVGICAPSAQRAIRNPQVQSLLARHTAALLCAGKLEASTPYATQPKESRTYSHKRESKERDRDIVAHYAQCK
jgi:hypothetical protein